MVDIILIKINGLFNYVQEITILIYLQQKQ